MFHLVGSIRTLLKIQEVNIDNNVFRLHYQVTLIFLILCSILVNSRQYFGDPIDCTSNSENAHLMDDYCWIHSFITTGPLVEVRVNPSLAIWEPKDRLYQSYYQWVGFVLFFQAILFFIPRYLWKYCWEEGKIKGMTLGMKNPFQEQDFLQQKTKLISDYFSKNIGTHNFYFYRYTICEVLNLINVIGQIFLMDAFLGQEFSTYGFDVLSVMNEIPEKRSDPMNRIFPKVVQCEFTKIGDAGNARPFDSICVLPLNIFNEKFYIFLWFWFIILAILTSLALSYRCMTIFIAPFRRYILLRRTKSADSASIKIMIRKCKVGDWFLFYQIGKNMDPLIFSEILQECSQRINSRTQQTPHKRILLLH